MNLWSFDMDSVQGARSSVTPAWPILPRSPTSTSQNLTELDALTVTPYCLRNLHFNDIRPLTWGTVPMQIAEGPLTYTPRQ